MFLRTRHLACLLLLLSSFGAAGAAVPHGRNFGPSARYIHALLARGAASTHSDSALFSDAGAHPGTPLAVALSPVAHKNLTLPRPMRAAAAQSASLQAATSFLRA